MHRLHARSLPQHEPLTQGLSPHASAHQAPLESLSPRQIVMSPALRRYYRALTALLAVFALISCCASCRPLLASAPSRRLAASPPRAEGDLIISGGDPNLATLSAECQDHATSDLPARWALPQWSETTTSSWGPDVDNYPAPPEVPATCNPDLWAQHRLIRVLTDMAAGGYNYCHHHAPGGECGMCLSSLSDACLLRAPIGTRQVALCGPFDSCEA